MLAHPNSHIIPFIFIFSYVITTFYETELLVMQSKLAGK